MHWHMDVLRRIEALTMKEVTWMLDMWLWEA
jgi:hypothetical protein